MKLVIKYLDNLRTNLSLLDRLRREHEVSINIMEREGLLTSGRIKEMRKTNEKVYMFLNDL